MQKLTLTACKYRLAGALVASALLCGPVSPGEADAARRGKPSCQATGQTILANEHLRIFQAGRTPDGWSLRYWACRANARKPRFLVSRDEESGSASIAIGGPFAIFPKGSCGTLQDGRSIDSPTCRGGLNIYDGRRNRTRFVRVGRSTDDLVPSIAGFVVTPRGWGAWLALDASNSNHQVVWILPPGGSPQPIAETHTGSHYVSYTALAINYDRLFWRIGDQTGSRVLR